MTGSTLESTAPFVLTNVVLQGDRLDDDVGLRTDQRSAGFLPAALPRSNAARLVIHQPPNN